ncbi:hypothetical protein FN976_07810 [Caenimonas sedimenti]|uniref:Uncharacterized protein n=1 Tax=Caenimonas sedimenti TaxID=2596921 RepID=A0A562ZTF2_9BURK|nr:hypothetical protein [Caenimonas sedimenti]TWO71889.1 hypothetical protein FN976_07810 [Caenimonas sedimenti]
MAKRTQNSGAGKARRTAPEARGPVARARHTGEGSASALATLQLMERDRNDGRGVPDPIDSPAPKDLKR